MRQTKRGLTVMHTREVQLGLDSGVPRVQIRDEVELNVLLVIFAVSAPH